METPIRIFSDLHLAHPASRIVDVAKFRPLIEGARTVVFNGDTFELRNDRQRARGEQLFEELKQICEDCGTEAHFLSGNHDPAISEMHSLDVANGNVFVTHGDVLFPTISPWNPKVWKLESEMQSIHSEFGESGDLEARLEATSRCRQIVDVVEKPRQRGPFWKLEAAFRAIWPPKRFTEMIRGWLVTAPRALQFVKHHRPNAKFFAIGHTHWAFVKEREDRVLINTGGFLSFGAAQFIEIEDSSISVHKIDESGECFQKGKEVFRSS